MEKHEYFPTDYEKFIYKSRYARWDEKKGRREEWPETVDRYLAFFKKHLKKNNNYIIPKKDLDRVREGILSFNVMPSMRCLMTAGPALARCNVAGYNCSYLPISGNGKQKKIFVEEIEDYISIGIKDPKDFDETMYILMCGTGVGFSVERQFVNKLPTVGKKLSRWLYNINNRNYPGVPAKELSVFDKESNTIHVADSKYGWASSLRILIVELYNGNFEIKWDVSQLRPAGARLKTFGGRSSGPAPLEELFRFCVTTLSQADGRKLTSIETHDIICKVGEVVVVGGVRRSALISLSNLTDDRMRTAKSGDWWNQNVQRTLANNSICYTEKPTMASFMKEWKALYDSKSGERGVFNRQAAKKKAAANGRRISDFEFGTNPCSEIILRPYQFCNLSEAVIKSTDRLEEIKTKVELATIIGTWQATLTNFKYLRPIWKRNTEEERLLGVSLTGIMDNEVMADGPNGMAFDLFVGEYGVYLDEILEILQNKAIETNKTLAKEIGIPQSAAITCVKPSGTVSQLVNSSSGIHTRFSEFYTRTVRGDNKDPITQFLIDQGVPNEPDISAPASVTVFSFPIKSPKKSKVREELTALGQLVLWKTYQDKWCEHKPSMTVFVKEEEWMEVGAWVYKNFDDVSGVSFLPHSEHNYQQAPYQEIDEKEYEEAVSAFPKLSWEKLSSYDSLEFAEKNVAAFACSGNESCEIVDIT